MRNYSLKILKMEIMNIMEAAAVSIRYNVQIRIIEHHYLAPKTTLSTMICQWKRHEQWLTLMVSKMKSFHSLSTWGQLSKFMRGSMLLKTVKNMSQLKHISRNYLDMSTKWSGNFINYSYTYNSKIWRLKPLKKRCSS